MRRGGGGVIGGGPRNFSEGGGDLGGLGPDLAQQSLARRVFFCHSWVCTVRAGTIKSLILAAACSLFCLWDAVLYPHGDAIGFSVGFLG